MTSRRVLLAGSPFLALSAVLPANGARTPRGLWFDPTQLPSYTGRLDRWLLNPAGQVDRGLLREGAQFVFPPSESEALAAAIERGGAITIWGIRARSAPVVTMLAWARADTDPASFVESPAWFASDTPGTQRLTISGRVQAPLLNPQGEPMGVILANSGTIRLTVQMHRQIAAQLDVGDNVAAEGLGTRRGDLVAIDAQRLGKDETSLQGLPETSP